MQDKKRTSPNLSRYLAECGLLYRGFHCYLPSTRQVQDEFSSSAQGEPALTITVCQKTKYTERLLVLVQNGTEVGGWQDWILELRLYHDVSVAEITAYHQGFIRGSDRKFALKAVPFDDRIRFHHLLLEWLVLAMNTSNLKIN